jgi:hypothetical protein
MLADVYLTELLGGHLVLAEELRQPPSRLFSLWSRDLEENPIPKLCSKLNNCLYVVEISLWARFEFHTAPSMTALTMSPLQQHFRVKILYPAHGSGRKQSERGTSYLLILRVSSDVTDVLPHPQLGFREWSFLLPIYYLLPVHDPPFSSPITPRS